MNKLYKWYRDDENPDILVFQTEIRMAPGRRLTITKDESEEDILGVGDIWLDIEDWVETEEEEAPWVERESKVKIIKDIFFLVKYGST